MHSQRGQASVELVALLPLLVGVSLALWQAVVVGHTMWSAAAAARAGARAAAIGSEDDARRVARRMVSAAAARGLRVQAGDDGEVRVRVALPAVVGGRLGTWTARARMEPQR